MVMTQDKISRVPFEEALDKTGPGVYSLRCAAICASAVIAYACVSYGGTILVPASACELGTTHAQQGLVLAAPFISGVIGSVVWGYLGDRRGRRRVLLATLSGAGALNAAASLSVSWPMLLGLQLCSSFLSTGIYPLAMTLLSESVPRARRDRTLLVMASLMLCSQGVMAGLAIPIIPLTFSYYLPTLGIYWNSWRALMLAYSLPCVISGLGILFFVQESPKFVLAKGDEDGALAILKIIHGINNTRDEFEVVGVRLEAQEQEAGTARRGARAVRELLRAPLRKYTLIMTLLFIAMQFIGALLIWLPKISIQFTKLLHTGVGSNMNLCEIIESGLRSDQQQALASPVARGLSCPINVTALLMILIVCSMQFVSNGILSLVVGRFGRRNSAMALVALCAASGALVPAAPHAHLGAALYALLLVGFIVVGPYTAIAVALFPTHLRTLAVAVTLTGGRLCGFFTIQAANVLLQRHCRLGFLLFSTVFASSVFLLGLLPDDRRGRPRTAENLQPPESEDGVALKLMDKPTVVLQG